MYLSELYDSGGSEIPLGVFIRANNRASSLYIKADEDLKRRIALFIYRLDVSMFRPWTIRDVDHRRDYLSIAFTYTVQALETFKPDKGAFIPWLRFYVLKAKEEYRNLYGTVTSELLNEVNILCDLSTINSEPDSLLWERVASLLSEDDYRLLQARVLESLTMGEIAGRFRLPLAEVSGRLNAMFKTLRKDFRMNTRNLYGQHKVKSLFSSIDPSILTDFDGATWISYREWQRRSGKSWGYIQSLVATTMSRSKAVKAEDIDREAGKVRYFKGRLPRLERRTLRAERQTTVAGFSPSPEPPHPPRSLIPTPPTPRFP